LGTFWQGELTWHHQSLALPGIGFVYATLSLALLVPACLLLLPQASNKATLPNWALGLGMVCFIAELGFFALLSIVYDFHECPYPSRSFPYFISGRLLLGALIPFLLIFAYGLDRALMRLGAKNKFLILFTWIGTMLAVEVATDWPALFNPYNWFHLP
jgi:hypothetical protein